MGARVGGPARERGPLAPPRRRARPGPRRRDPPRLSGPLARSPPRLPRRQPARRQPPRPLQRRTVAPARHPESAAGTAHEPRQRGARPGYLPARLPRPALTGLAVLLGVPVTHSLSPALHNAAFREHGIPAAYVACDVPPDRLAEAVHGLDALGAMGANVTIPHKQAVQAHCAAIAPEAAVVGAVNTLVRGEAGWIGHNTDVAGFLTPLADHALDGAEVTVLGAGGAARAVVYGLLSAFSPSRITIASRRPEQADALAEAFAAHDTAGALAVAAMEDAP
ncbi:MAG TPA: hypothetical protein EYG39_01005, partial [Rhodothermales bacterium]|nr:hypothetical protein [Rhodothermales bacterium]